MTPKRPGPASGWTNERIETARRMYLDEGCSASQIARAIGGVTRNAVIGLLHRRGFRRTNDGLKASLSSASINLRPVRMFRAKPKVALALKPVAPPPPSAPTGPGKSLLDLGHHECRWPLGDHAEPGTIETLFCSSPVEWKNGEARLFCPYHCTLGFSGQPLRPIRAWDPTSRPTRKTFAHDGLSYKTAAE
jgi:GcrA cell cycle regulator